MAFIGSKKRRGYRKRWLGLYVGTFELTSEMPEEILELGHLFRVALRSSLPHRADIYCHFFLVTENLLTTTVVPHNTLFFQGLVGNYHSTDFVENITEFFFLFQILMASLSCLESPRATELPFFERTSAAGLNDSNRWRGLPRVRNIEEGLSSS